MESVGGNAKIRGSLCSLFIVSVVKFRTGSDAKIARVVIRKFH